MTARFVPLLLLFFVCCAALGKPPKSPKPPQSAVKEETAVSFAIGPRPAWVRFIEVRCDVPAELASGGISYPLTDEQHNVEPRASYYHDVRYISSENGVQNGASLSVVFDPSYQKLTFHTLRIIRQGVVKDRLDRSRIKLLQREEEMESFLYDGSYTANCQFEDVRVGDFVEFEYSLDGQNPVQRGKFYDHLSTEWSVPIVRASARIIAPAARQLNFAMRNREIHPSVTTEQGKTVWRWDEDNIPARRTDSHLPRGFNPYGFVQVSEFADWKQVADWAVPLYEVAGALSPEVREQIAALQAIEKPEERVLAALRFVQEQIRYLGIESGIGSHQPTPPSEVLRRRFGDCKDKTLLLATLLRSTGLTATPALVNTNLRKYLADRVPSPGLFNHVILHVEAAGATYWLDATRSNQQGPLDQVAIGDYGYALLVRPGTTALTAYSPPPKSLPKKKLVETYRIAAPEEVSQLEVVTDFHGASAEGQRDHFQNTPLEKIQKQYLEYYARRYPGVSAPRPPECREIPGENACQVKEYYSIPGIWELDAEKKQYKLSLFPNDIYEDMGTPGSTNRTDPLALSHPTDVTQEIRAEMFEPWKLARSENNVTNAHFRYHEESSSKGSTVVMSYSFQSLADQVAPAELAAYDSALRKIQDRMGYNFTYRTPAQIAATSPQPAPATPAPAGASASPDPASDQFNWPIALFLGTLFLISVVGCVLLFIFSKRSSPLPPSLTHPHLAGLGGWLVLVGIGHFGRPLVYLGGSITIWPTIFSLQHWQTLTSVGQASYHPMWMPILLFEFIYNMVSLVFSILLLVLFFAKRAVWKRYFSYFLVWMVLGVTLDLILAEQIPATAVNRASTLAEVIKTVVVAAIWIPYCNVSERVKATFRF